MKSVIKWIVGIFIFLLIVGACSSDNKPSKPKQYTSVNINSLLDGAKANPVRLKQDYEGKPIKLVGAVVDDINSDAWWFIVRPQGYRWDWLRVRVVPQNKAQERKFGELVKDKPIYVYGTVTDANDVLGVTMDLDKFEQ